MQSAAMWQTIQQPKRVGEFIFGILWYFYKNNNETEPWAVPVAYLWEQFKNMNETSQLTIANFYCLSACISKAELELNIAMWIGKLDAMNNPLATDTYSASHLHRRAEKTSKLSIKCFSFWACLFCLKFCFRLYFSVILACRSSLVSLLTIRFFCLWNLFMSVPALSRARLCAQNFFRWKDLIIARFVLAY